MKSQLFISRKLRKDWQRTSVDCYWRNGGRSKDQGCSSQSAAGSIDKWLDNFRSQYSGWFVSPPTVFSPQQGTGLFSFPLKKNVQCIIFSAVPHILSIAAHIKVSSNWKCFQNNTSLIVQNYLLQYTITMYRIHYENLKSATYLYLSSI